MLVVEGLFVGSTMSSVATLKKYKTLVGPIKRTKKSQGHILIHLAYISGKNPTFPVKIPSFPEKIPFHLQKFLTTFFLSHRLSFSKFLPTFSNFQPFWHQIYCSFLTSTRKTLKLMYFPVQYGKTQAI